MDNLSYLSYKYLYSSKASSITITTYTYHLHQIYPTSKIEMNIDHFIISITNIHINEKESS